jgi:AraC family transcriptional regulator of adaptative response/methylated-DNA-[protein]-cysteine methyltransferase
MTNTLTAPVLPDDAHCWDAVVRRDHDVADAFVYAVRTTGVYCRPGCSSRTPRRENVSFYATAEEAAAAGFRPCRRCRPGAALIGSQPGPGAEAVGRAVAYIQARPGVVPPLAELAKAAGSSPAQLQRNFSRLVGVSPRAYAQALRRERFKAGLRRGDPVSRAGWDAGYGSSRQLYEQGADALGMAPSDYRRGGEGLTIRWTVVSSPAGPLLLAATERGLCTAWFGKDERSLSQALRREYDRAELHRDDQALAVMADQVRRHLSDSAPMAQLPLDVGGSAFARQVWNRLRQIPYGETRTYAQVAADIGRPGAARAVGNACAANPVALVIPCHRVVRAAGGAGAYRWGADRKQALLAREASGGSP